MKSIEDTITASKVGTVLSIWLIFVMSLCGTSVAQPVLQPGKILLQGSYTAKKVRLGKRRVNFYSLHADESLRLKIGGSVSLVIQARSRKKTEASIVFMLDGDLASEQKVLFAPGRAQNFYLSVPPGTHELSVMCSNDVLFRPVKVHRNPMAGEKEVVFVSLSNSTAGSGIKPVDKSTDGDIPPLMPLVKRNVSTVSEKKTGSKKKLRSVSVTGPSVQHSTVEVRTINANMLPSRQAVMQTKRSKKVSIPLSGKKSIENDNGELGLGLLIAIGGGTVEQTYVHTQQTVNLSVGVNWEMVDGIGLEFSYDNRFHWQQYRSRNPDPVSLEPQVIDVREQFWDIGLGVSFDFINNKWYQALSVLGVKFSLAPRLVVLDNNVIGEMTGGIRLGLKIDTKLSGKLHAIGWGGWLTPIARPDSSLDLAGVPSHFWDFGVGLRWLFGGLGPFESWSLELGWRSDLIVFEHASRTYNAAVLGISTSL